MIRYQLHCDKDHEFEGWFASSAAFDKQSKRGLVVCPECGSSAVDKSIMAPNVGIKGNRKSEAQRSDAVVSAANGSAAETSPSYAELRAALRKVREEVEAKAEYVGPRFAEEARKIHHQESEQRGIYGEASLEDAHSLLKEGIDFLPLPRLPEDYN